MLKAIFFDLDGTLLDTIDDIKDALNEAIRRSGLPFKYERKDVCSFIGNGSDALLRKALGNLDTKENFKILKTIYLPLYEEYQQRNTYAFEGVKDSLRYLEGKYMLFVFSNKPDYLAKQILKKALGDIHFISVDGHKENEPPKPNPAILINEMKKHSLNPDECLMVGDSLPDIQVARNGGLKAGLCLWGYGQYDQAILSEADFIFNSPLDWKKL